MAALTEQDTKLAWNQEAFEALKRSFFEASILRHPNPNREDIVLTDPANYVSAWIPPSAAIGYVAPCGLLLKKHSPAGCNSRFSSESTLERKYYVSRGRFVANENICNGSINTNIGPSVVYRSTCYTKGTSCSLC